MPLEIERKFLVGDAGWLDPASGANIVQGYVASDAAAIRVRIKGAAAWLTFKSKGAALSRAEYDYPIPVDHAREMIDLFCGDRIVAKRRFDIREGDAHWSVDVFSGRHAGLVVAEIELRADDEAIVPPAWLGRDVTGDARYLNEALADPARPTPPTA